MRVVAKAVGRGNYRHVVLEVESTEGLFPGDTIWVGTEKLRIVAVHREVIPEPKGSFPGCFLVLIFVVVFWVSAGMPLWPK